MVDSPVATAFNQAFRDFNTDGVESSGHYKPAKSTLRSIGATIDAAIGVAAGGGVAVEAVYETRSELYADLAHGNKTFGVVWGGDTPGHVGIYIKSGSSGSGSWTKTDLVLGPQVLVDISELWDAVDTLDSSVDTLYDQITVFLPGNTTTGTGASYSATSGFDYSSVSRPTHISFIPNVSNTSTTPTLAYDSVPAKQIVRADGSNIAIGGLVAGWRYLLEYDGEKFRILGDARQQALRNLITDLDDKLGIVKRGITYNLISSEWSLNSTVNSVLLLTSEQPLSSLQTPVELTFISPSTTNKGPLVLLINGSISVECRGADGAYLLPDDLVPGCAYKAYYDGTFCRIRSGIIASNLIKGLFPIGVDSRPGNSPHLYTTSTMVGAPETNLRFKLWETYDSVNGRVVPIIGAKTLCNINVYPVEAGRYYKARWAFSRRTNADTGNDLVNLGIVWLSKDFEQLGTTLLEDESLEDITVASGRQQRQAIVSTTSKITNPRVDINPISGAVYCRLYIQTFGNSTVTDAEIMEWKDVTDGNIIAPNISAVEAAVAAITSQNLTARMASLESLVGDGYGVITVRTFADALALTVNDDVEIIRTLGYYEEGDGGECSYKRASTPPTEHEMFVETLNGKYFIHADREVALKQAGAFIDGETDDTDALERWIYGAWSMGKKGTAYVAGVCMGFEIRAEGLAKDIDLDFGPSFMLKAIAQSDTSLTRPLLNIDSNVSDHYSRPRARIRGGIFNNADMAYGNPEGAAWDQGSGGARGGALGFTRFRQVDSLYLTVQGGTNYFDADGKYVDQSVVGGDQGITYINCVQTNTIGCYFAGQPDNAIYPRHNDPEGVPGVHYVSGCFFYRCHSAFYFKFSGGRGIVEGNTMRECRKGGSFRADFNEGSVSLYQPYEIQFNNNRLEKCSLFALDMERVQRGTISNNVIYDWGYRNNDGVLEPDTYDSVCPAIKIAGCRNLDFVGNNFGLLDWNGSSLLELFMIRADAANGGGPDWKCKSIRILGGGGRFAPYVYDSETGQGEETDNTDNIGIGTAVRVQGTDSNEVSIYHLDIPNSHIRDQKYRFSSGTTQFVVERPTYGVASPSGSPWNGDMLSVYSRGHMTHAARGVRVYPNDGETSTVIGNKDTGQLIIFGSGSPEGVQSALIGSIFLRSNGGANTTLYVKESGSGNTGWVAK